MSVAPETSKKPNGGISPQFLLDTIRQHPVAFLCILVASLSASVTVYVLYPLPKNTAAVIFQLHGNAPRVINPMGENAIDMKTFQQNQVGFIKTRAVLSEALKDENASRAVFLRGNPYAVDWLDQNLKIDFKTGQQFMRVYLEGNYPDDMLAVLKAISNAYEKKLEARDNSERNDKLRQVEDSIAEQKEIIDRFQKRVNTISQSLGSTDIKALQLLEDSLREDMKTAKRSMTEYQNLLNLAKRDLPISIVDKIEKKVDLKVINFDDIPISELPVDEVAIDKQLRLHPKILDAESKVSQAKEKLAMAQAPFEKNTVNPSITRAQEEVVAAENALKRITAEIRAILVNDARAQSKIEQRKILKHNIEDAVLLYRKYEEVEKSYKAAEAAILKHLKYAVELDQQRKDIAHHVKLLDSLQEIEQRIRIESRASKRVELIEEPFVTTGVEGFKALRTSLMAGGGLFGLGFGLLVFWETRLRRVNRTEDLAPLGLAILGTLPQHQELNAPNIELMEAVDSTRTLLLRSHSVDRSVRVIAVTSGMPGEGKTSLSAQLAISLARAGYRTLLVDGDVHAPRIHDIFKLQPSPGLCEVLRDEVPMGAAIQTSDMTGLFVMPAGNWSMMARQYLVGDRWIMLRRDLESQFDFVVIDTAPLLMMTDTMLLALRVDGVVLSVLAGKSQMSLITRTKERLESLGVRVLGVVMNGVSARFPGYHYGPYAGKYSARYEAAIEPVPLAALTAVPERTMEKSS